jgi:putative transposase
MSRPPRIPNWLPWEQDTVYFMTFCVEGRKAVLANKQTWEICCSTFQKLDQWTILCAIAMPNHFHILGVPSDRDAKVSSFAKWFKRWFNEAYQEAESNRSVPNAESSWRWQEGCFDRLLRSDESVDEKWEYMRQNPVRAGLVADADDWPYQYQFNEGIGV